MLCAALSTRLFILRMGDVPRGIKDKAGKEAAGHCSAFLERRVLEGLFIYK